MKKFGSWTEMVAAVFREDTFAITFRPNQGTTYTAARDIQMPPGDADHVVVSEDATQTLTNKTMDGDQNTFQDFITVDSGDTTKRIDIDPSGNTTSVTTTLASSSTSNQTVTLPNATDTLVGRATTDTLTNKTIRS